jgi:Ca2+:H+ antiporter
MKRCTPMKHYTPMVTITTLAILGPVFLILPCAFYNVLEPDIDGGVVVMSRGIAVVSLSVYLLMLLFQFKTHEAPQQSYQELTELPITLAVIAVCGNILIMIPCVYFLVNAVTQFEPSEKLICGLFVIPIATRMQIYIVALGDGLRHGVELASARVYCRSLPAVLFIYPTMVILSWIVEGEQQSLTMRFDAIDVKVLGIVVWTNNMSLRYKQMDYLLGTELLIV